VPVQTAAVVARKIRNSIYMQNQCIKGITRKKYQRWTTRSWMWKMLHGWFFPLWHLPLQRHACFQARRQAEVDGRGRCCSL